MPLSQTEYLWSGATPLLLISPARFFLYKGPKIDYFLTPPLDYRLLFNLVSAWGAAHLCSCSTLLLKDEHPPAGLPFDAARSPDATRGATPARTRMASATCPGLTLDGPRLPILGCILPNCGAARGEDSLLQSPAECGRMHAPVDSETDLTLAV